MALPTKTEPSDKKQQRRDAEQEMLMREVDDAVRQDQVSHVAKRYGVLIGAALVLGLAGFGGYLLWSDSNEGGLEEQSEALILATDELEAGNSEAADSEFAALAEDAGASVGARTTATLARAGIALGEGRREEAVRLYDQVAADADVPQPYRDLATIRSVTANFEAMEPQAVVDRLRPLATPGSPWFGSAGELLGMAYMAQERDDLAGPLFAEIATDDSVPETIRSRVRQMAGLLGYDAIEDVDETLAELQSEGEGAGPGAPVGGAPTS